MNIGLRHSGWGRLASVFFGGASNIDWDVYWAGLISATVEDADPDAIILTFPSAQTTLTNSDFTCTINGVARTISSASWTGSVLTLVLASNVLSGDTVVVTFTTTGGTTNVENNVIMDFDLYANFYGDDHTFSDSDTITAGYYGVQNGTFHVKDASTGVIAMADKYMTGYGKADWTSTILYAEALTISYGRVIKFNFICPRLIATFIAGLCKADLSDVQTSTIQFYSQTSGEILNVPSVHRLQTRVELVEYEIKFVLGGFDVNGYPYNGGSTSGYEYGYYVFVRSNIYPFWFLAGVSKDSIGTSVVPFVSFYSTDTSPYGKLPILKMMSYQHTNFQCLPTGFINTSSNNQFTGFNVNNALLSFRTDIAKGEEVSLYFCIDDYTTPTEGYRLKIVRSTTIVLTMYRIDDGVETSIAVSNAVSTPRNFVWRFYKGLIYDLNALTNYTNLDISAYSGNTKAKIVDGANSHLVKMAWYAYGATGEYRSLLKLNEPFFVGANAPGYGLVGETRKGHYFDVSSHASTFGCEVISTIAYLVNGSNQMSVRFYSHSEQRWITDLDVTLTLRFAYSGTNAVLCIASDPHFGYAAQDAAVNYKYQIIPDLTTLGVTHCFILGDIVHDDATYYATYITAKGLYPSATWYELNGNHDLANDFKTDLGYADVSHVETIGNCAFIMCGTVTDTTCVINHTFLGSSLTSNTDKNCFIMSHAGRYNTTNNTDTYHAEVHADIETAVGSNKFVAWFAGHQHGWQNNARKVTTAKYLNLGDNN